MPTFDNKPLFSFDDALWAAKKVAKEEGVAYAVQWPIGTVSVETRKPSIRNSNMRVVECWDDGREVLA